MSLWSSHFRAVFVLMFSSAFLVSCDNHEMGEVHISKATPIGWEEKEPCQIKALHNGDSAVLTATIKCRGGSSSKFNKHSYRLELDQATDFFGIENDDDWVLNASYIDKTFMRHKLCYDLFMQMGEWNQAPKSDFVQVSINGRYDGVYLLKEKLTASRLGLNKSDSGARLFKGPYIFKRDLDWTQLDTTLIIHQKFPSWNKNPKTDELVALREFVLESSDEEFALQYKTYFDLKNVMDWHLLLWITNGGDGLIKNNYLYRKDSQSPFRFALWDCDHSLGRDADGELNMLNTTPNFENNILLSRLMAVKEIKYQESVKERYHDLRNSGVFSVENLERMIHEMEYKLAPYIHKNAERWPLDAEWYYDDNGFEEEVKILKEFVHLNFEKLDKRFDYK